MPEIKHNFVKGHMNKDLDERLVPDGEYRDALNVQVVTSDGSDLGALQNIKGNTKRSTTNNMYCGGVAGCYANSIISDYDVEGCITVGTVTDNTNDTIFWLQHLNHKAIHINSGDGSRTYDYHQVLEFDRILEYNTITQSVTPVLVDNYKTTTYAWKAGVAFDQYTTMILDADALGLNISGIRAGMTVTCWDDTTGVNIWTSGSGTGHYLMHPDVVVTVRDVNHNTNEITLTKSNHLVTDSGAPFWSEDFISPGVSFPQNAKFIFEEDKVLNFDEDRLITGINIIDGILFFTDNETEPKKVHIERSKLGTPDLISHTKVYSNGILHDGTSTTPLAYIEERHITVIKKSPLFPPTLKISNTVRSGGDSIVNTVSPNNPIFSAAAIVSTTSVTAQGGANGCDVWSISGTPLVDRYVLGTNSFMYDPTTSGLYFIDDDPVTPNPTTTILIPTIDPAVDWQINDRIILKATSVSQGIANIHEVYAKVLALPVSYDILSATDEECWAYENSYSSVDIEFLTIPTDIPTDATDILGWDAKLDQEKESMFKFKFPRFAYRWKFDDGEYSCFSPFTETAFVPSKFDY